MANSNTDKRVVYHVVPDASTNRWVLSEENGDFRQEFDRKKDAEEHGKELAERATVGQLKVRKRNGKMDYQITYNQHPVNSRS